MWVLVEWWDASSAEGTWIHPEDIDPEPCTVFTAGWLLSPTPRPGHLAVAGSRIDKTGQVGDVTLVPLGMVRSLSALRVDQVLPVERCAA